MVSIGWLAREQRIPYVSSMEFLSDFAFLETLNPGITGCWAGAFLVVVHCGFHASRRFYCFASFLLLRESHSDNHQSVRWQSRLALSLHLESHSILSPVSCTAHTSGDFVRLALARPASVRWAGVLEQWAYWIKNTSEHTVEELRELLPELEFLRAKGELNAFRDITEEKQRYDAREKASLDIQSNWIDARQGGEPQKD